MTAELIVMNKYGVALAADSAVTVNGGNNPSKVYNSANKLFALSKHNPVGVMIYGSAEVMGIPWEVVIKTYRRELGTTTFDCLADYMDDFFRYLKNDAFTDTCYQRYVLERSIDFLGELDDVDKEAGESIQKRGSISEQKYKCFTQRPWRQHPVRSTRSFNY